MIEIPISNIEFMVLTIPMLTVIIVGGAYFFIIKPHLETKSEKKDE